MKVEFKGNKGEHSAVSRLLFVHCSYKTSTAAVPREGGTINPVSVYLHLILWFLKLVLLLLFNQV